MSNCANISIPTATNKELKAVAAMIGCSMSKIADKAINAYLNDSVENIIEKMKEKDDES